MDDTEYEKNVYAHEKSEDLMRETIGEYSIFDDGLDGNLCDDLEGINSLKYEPIHRRTMAINELIKKELEYNANFKQFIKAITNEDASNQILPTLTAIHKQTKVFCAALQAANYDFRKIANTYKTNICLFERYMDYVLNVKRPGFRTECKTNVGRSSFFRSGQSSISATSRILFHISFLKALKDLSKKNKDDAEALEDILKMLSALIHDCELQIDIDSDVDVKFNFATRGKLFFREDFWAFRAKCVVFMFETVILFTLPTTGGSLTYKNHIFTSTITKVRITKQNSLILVVKIDGVNLEEIELKSKSKETVQLWENKFRIILNY